MTHPRPSSESSILIRRNRRVLLSPTPELRIPPIYISLFLKKGGRLGVPSGPATRSQRMPTRYLPLGDKHAGVIAVATCASLSVLSILLLVLYSAWLVCHHFRRSASERASTSRGIVFLTSNHGFFFLSLIAGDLFQAIGFSMNWTWIARGGLPSPVNETCTTQAIFVLSYTPPTPVVYGSIASVWIVTGIMAGIGPARFGSRESPFYGIAGGWCWIAQSHQIWRLWLHYFWVFLVAGINLIAYSIIAFQIVRRRRRALSSSNIFGTTAAPTKAGPNLGGSNRIAAIMLIYPLVYLITILPISVYRFALLSGKTPPIHYALAAGCVFTLSGMINCLVYASTRNIVSFSSLRRKGSAVTGAGMIQFTQGGMEGLGPTISVRRPSMADFQASMLSGRSGSVSGSLLGSEERGVRSVNLMGTSSSGSHRGESLGVLSGGGGGGVGARSMKGATKISTGSWNDSLEAVPESQHGSSGATLFHTHPSGGTQIPSPTSISHGTTPNTTPPTPPEMDLKDLSIFESRYDRD
ncbi:BQ5605_C013g07132 [Microbotryum silenes-dioicae]|uniref:BQ5605_C013g07132 protein n=1 Tax=Microbotryum silenes-dioicae TaxID=796604 RepID=A0A2X0LQZ7_9BASI|nr:BQ5605_C013g07132 [Microbotryum silenes-dioicae]